MAPATLKRVSNRLAPVAGILSLLASFYLLQTATEGSTRFGQLYILLLLVNALGLIVLVSLIGSHLFRLVRQFRAGEAGSSITTRLVVLFIVLAVAPVTVVFSYSLQALHRSIDSWFDLRIEQALSDALELSQAALGVRMRVLLEDTQQAAERLANAEQGLEVLTLMSDLRTETDAAELTLLAPTGDIIASNSVDPSQVLPFRPSNDVLLQARGGKPYVDLVPGGETGLHILALAPLGKSDQAPLLSALFPISERMNSLADSVQSAYTTYKELVYLRTPLKQTFTLTLSMVLLLSVLAAVWAAFFSARRLTQPMLDLVEGTRAIAAGDYSRKLPIPANEDLGRLVASFNDMTRQLDRARRQAQRSRQEVEDQRSHLEALLARLSSGVLTLDGECRLQRANTAASAILGIDLAPYAGRSFDDVVDEHEHLRSLLSAMRPHLSQSEADWREEITLFGSSGRQSLMCSGAPLAEAGGEHVVVFDDVTALIQAQRDAAWGEMARRLAHEIKNPLTPIQLAAERLRHKFLRGLEGRDAEVFDRSIQTIVQQVEAMKTLVNDFRDYARPPSIELSAVDLNQLVNDVGDLYRAGSRTDIIISHLDPALPPVPADANRLRQVLHNLIKNGVEAVAGKTDGYVILSTHHHHNAHQHLAELVVSDNGPGLPGEVLERPFEPYVTTKPKGTGLGLPIVKKIVEEHGGTIDLSCDRGGTCITIRLPVEEPADAADSEAAS